MTYTELKETYQKKLSKVMEDNHIFWAFNTEQLKEGIEKHEISKENKMVSIGMGGYMPYKNREAFIKAQKDLDAWRKLELKEIKANKEEAEKAILYELGNFECFYTGDITNACEALPEIDKAEVKRVFNKYASAYCN